jgi:hypothetical protein
MKFLVHTGVNAPLRNATLRIMIAALVVIPATFSLESSDYKETV